MSAGLFVDVANLYHCVGKRFPGRKLDYKKLLERARSIAEVDQAVAYGTRVGEEADAFMAFLRKLGFELRFKEFRIDRTDPSRPAKRSDWEVPIAIDVVRRLWNIRTVILASSNPTFAELGEWVREQGCEFVVLACGIPGEVRATGSRCIEIAPDLLEPSQGFRAAA
jgi:uncharacterized LabA/DUF88 family protein